MFQNTLLQSPYSTGTQIKSNYNDSIQLNCRNSSGIREQTDTPKRKIPFKFPSRVRQFRLPTPFVGWRAWQHRMYLVLYFYLWKSFPDEEEEWEICSAYRVEKQAQLTKLISIKTATDVLRERRGCRGKCGKGKNNRRNGCRNSNNWSLLRDLFHCVNLLDKFPNGCVREVIEFTSSSWICGINLLYFDKKNMRQHI